MKEIENKNPFNIINYLKEVKQDKSFPKHLIPFIDFSIKSLNETDTNIDTQIQVINLYMPTKYKIK